MRRYEEAYGSFPVVVFANVVADEFIEVKAVKTY